MLEVRQRTDTTLAAIRWIAAFPVGLLAGTVALIIALLLQFPFPAPDAWTKPIDMVIQPLFFAYYVVVTAASIAPTYKTGASIGFGILFGVLYVALGTLVASRLASSGNINGATMTTLGVVATVAGLICACIRVYRTSGETHPFTRGIARLGRAVLGYGILLINLWPLSVYVLQLIRNPLNFFFGIFTMLEVLAYPRFWMAVGVAAVGYAIAQGASRQLQQLESAESIATSST